MYRNHFANYFFIGDRAGMSGERFKIVDRFTDRANTLCQLYDEISDSRALFFLSGIMNLDGQTILLLGSPSPEDRESEFQTYSVVRLLSSELVELVEESFTKRIQPVAEMAIELDRRENQELMCQCFGPFREYDPKVPLN
jgi:hypothetical protein